MVHNHCGCVQNYWELLRQTDVYSSFFCCNLLSWQPSHGVSFDSTQEQCNHKGYGLYLCVFFLFLYALASMNGNNPTAEVEHTPY